MTASRFLFFASFSFLAAFACSEGTQPSDDGPIRIIGPDDAPGAGADDRPGADPSGGTPDGASPDGLPGSGDGEQLHWCKTDQSCPDDRPICVDFLDEIRDPVCAAACVNDGDCPDGTGCFAIDDGTGACVPGHICHDEDGDGAGNGPGCDARDCDDTRDDVHPEAVEICDGIDNDCDGVVDTEHGEICGDGEDNDCDGVVDNGCPCEAEHSVLLISGPMPWQSANPPTCAAPPCPPGHDIGRWLDIWGIEWFGWSGAPLTPAALDAAGVTLVIIYPPDGSYYQMPASDIQGLVDWAKQGNGLLVLTDNIPFISISDAIAAQFGVSYSRSGLANIGPLQRADGTLHATHCLTNEIDGINGGVTPSHINFPETDPRYSLVSKVGDTNLMLAYEDGPTRIVFDAAFTKYHFFTRGWELGLWMRNVVHFASCGCERTLNFDPCAGVASHCAAQAYTACTCDPSDPCGWSGDGACDASSCMQQVGTAFDDGSDC